MTTTPIGRADVMIMLLALALYAATGIAIAFLVFGVTRVLAKPVPVTLGARIASTSRSRVYKKRGHANKRRLSK